MYMPKYGQNVPKRKNIIYFMNFYVIYLNLSDYIYFLRQTVKKFFARRQAHRIVEICICQNMVKMFQKGRTLYIL